MQFGGGSDRMSNEADKTIIGLHFADEGIVETFRTFFANVKEQHRENGDRAQAVDVGTVFGMRGGVRAGRRRQ